MAIANKGKARKAQMPIFNWLFAIIIGAVILFLAIYFSGKLIGVEKYREVTELVNRFDILFNPFASLGAIGQITMCKSITLPIEAQIDLSCSVPSLAQPLGRQTMKLRAVENGYSEWSVPKISNKYLFSTRILESKDFFVCGKPLELPFRVDDLIYVLDKEYCFVGAVPARIESELTDMEFPIEFVRSRAGCPAGSISVCFTGAGCDMTATATRDASEGGSVSRNGRTVYFLTDALLYSAIFSSTAEYQCNLRRLLKRLALLGELYTKKIPQLEQKGCEMRDIQSRLEQLHASAEDLQRSANPRIVALYSAIEQITQLNSRLECPVF